MEIKEIRRRNLEELIIRAGSVRSLADKINSNPAHISQIRRGHRNVGHAVARRLESAFRLPDGALDAPGMNQHSVAEPSSDYASVEPGPALHAPVPVISWVQAGEFCETHDPLYPGEYEKTVPAPTHHSDSAYALRVSGESMMPVFQPGEIIIVEPEKHADSGNFVIAKKTSSGEANLKQLLIDAGQPYLKASNPDWPERIIKIDESWHICGVVIASVKRF